MNLAAPSLQTDFATIEVEPLSPTVGAEITGFRMDGNVKPEQLAEIRQALVNWKVIFFRDQDVALAEHVAFGRLFGELEIHPFARNNEEYPEVLTIHHTEKTKAGQNDWHSDVTWRQEPSLGSILRAKIVPPVSGDTLFCDMNAAYHGLDEMTRKKIHGLYAIHRFDRVFGKNLSDEKRAEMEARYPPARHPVVRTHPESGLKSLYVNDSFVSHIDGMEKGESRRLLDRLYRQTTLPEYQVRFRWRVNSVAFWDNRAVQHYAAFDYHPQERRVERVTIVGDRPV
ncbi:MAG TPA: taurine dioxygenase [Myxococcales bacterium]|jgi:taurine dioxygenase|nr:taurine dioxygenase [Myxococcales bacterium]HIL01027.1 taurine dioxygenase [Myxococcales bacterium]